MKKIMIAVGLLLCGSITLFAQNWVNGGNSFAANGKLGTNDNFSLVFETNNVERGRLTNTGSWGIGTNTPQSQLHFTADLTTGWGTDMYHYDASFQSAHRKKIWLRRDWNSAAPFLGDYLMLCSSGNRSNTNQSSIVLAQGGIFLGRGKEDGAGLSKEWLRIDQNGNVGIGTAAPSQQLHVVGTEVLSSGFQAGFKFRNRGSASASDDWVWYAENNIARLWNALNGDIISLTRAGSLTLKGSIHAREVRVTATAGADFVFAEDYALPSLQQVARYVKEHKHLPEIASEQQMLKEGLNIGAFQIQLLQKVEELTLYLIEQDKRIQALEAENKNLKNR